MQQEQRGEEREEENGISRKRRRRNVIYSFSQSHTFLILNLVGYQSGNVGARDSQGDQMSL
jgi:hypothetical protein